MRALILASLVSLSAVAQPAGPQPAQQQAAAPSGNWMQSFDELWKKRDQPGAEKQLHEILKPPLATDPNDFEANWRLAYLLIWQANETQGDLKAALGKAAWAAGDKAIAARPNDVRGHYMSGTGLGLYSEGVGILTALRQGLEGKFRDRLLTALKLDKDYLDGAPQVVWGRYFSRLPWPKKNLGESIRVLREAIKGHPNNWRAKIYLADSLADADRADLLAEGKKLIQEVLAAPPGHDAPEEKRLKAMAQQWMNAHK